LISDTERQKPPDVKRGPVALSADLSNPEDIRVAGRHIRW